MKVVYLLAYVYTKGYVHKEINPTHTHAGNHMNMIKKCYEEIETSQNIISLIQ